MLTNCSAVLYHFDEAKEEWRRSFFPCAFFYRFSDSRISPGDFSEGNRAVIRIPGYAKTDISVGDYILMGKSDENQPDTSRCFKVTAFSKNSFGTSPHLKIICS